MKANMLTKTYGDDKINLGTLPYCLIQDWQCHCSSVWEAHPSLCYLPHPTPSFSQSQQTHYPPQNPLYFPLPLSPRCLTTALSVPRVPLCSALLSPAATHLSYSSASLTIASFLFHCLVFVFPCVLSSDFI